MRLFSGVGSCLIILTRDSCAICSFLRKMKEDFSLGVKLERSRIISWNGEPWFPIRIKFVLKDDAALRFSENFIDFSLTQGKEFKLGFACVFSGRLIVFSSGNSDSMLRSLAVCSIREKIFSGFRKTPSIPILISSLMVSLSKNPETIMIGMLEFFSLTILEKSRPVILGIL